jgi:hypothetical protein
VFNVQVTVDAIYSSRVLDKISNQLRMNSLVGSLIVDELTESFVISEEIATKDFKSLIMSGNLHSVVVGLDGKSEA